MIVIADTTPLHYLIQLGYPEILEAIYGRVLVPSAVLAEMKHPGAPPEVQAWAVAPPALLEQRQVQHLDRTLAEELGPGERQAISLALELRADVLLVDDLAARREAQERHIVVAGTLAILLQASLRGFCELPDAIQRLKRLGFWFSAPVEADVLARYDKARKRQ